MKIYNRFNFRFYTASALITSRTEARNLTGGLYITVNYFAFLCIFFSVPPCEIIFTKTKTPSRNREGVLYFWIKSPVGEPACR
jgi:hypothetical protein